MKLYLALPAIAIALSGCIEKDAQSDGLAKATAAVKEININAESPDMAVKSWWRLRDAEILLAQELCKQGLKQAEGLSSKISVLTTDHIYTGPRCAFRTLTFDREIKIVDVQSDTRAIVTAQIKNTTPPEEGAVPDSEEKKAKEQGETYRYVLEREGPSAKWKIAQVFSKPSYGGDWVEWLKVPEPSINRWVYENHQ